MVKMLTARDLYESNADFRDVVNRYATCYNEGKSIPVEDALQHKVIEAIARFYFTER